MNFKGSDPKRGGSRSTTPLQASKEQRSFYVPFIADPTVGGRAFIGLEHVWRTDDHGGDPAFLAAALQLAASRCRTVRRLAADGQQSDARLCGQRSRRPVRGRDRPGAQRYLARCGRPPGSAGVWVSTDVNAPNPSNVHFYRIDTLATPGRFVSGIAVDPADPNHAWISYSGYGAYTPGTPQHVLEARFDRQRHTATFVDRSYDIGDQPVTGMAVYAATGDLYAATDFGVLRLPARATHWERAEPDRRRLPFTASRSIRTPESSTPRHTAGAPTRSTLQADNRVHLLLRQPVIAYASASMGGAGRARRCRRAAASWCPARGLLLAARRDQAAWVRRRRWRGAGLMAILPSRRKRGSVNGR